MTHLEYNYRRDKLHRRGETNEFAVVIFLPPQLDGIVQPHREKFDPDHQLVDSHISLVFPFKTQQTIDDVARTIYAETAERSAFRVELSSIGDFYPEYPIIYWCVKVSPVINTLYKSLHARLDLPLPHKQFVPHVTVAKEISDHRVVMVKERILPYLPDEHFYAGVDRSGRA